MAHPVIPDAAPTTTFETIDDVVAVLIPVMHGITEAVGRYCEVVLHDLTGGDLAHSIIAIENGEVTGRHIGGPSTNLGLDLLNDESVDPNRFGYRGRTSDGRELHSSSIYFRNPTGRIIAALCINVDTTPFQVLQDTVASVLPPALMEQPEMEIVAPDISSILATMIDDAVRTVGKAVPLMSKTDRIEVLRLLQDRGAFHVKKAVNQVAKRLGISRVTAYGYLDEIRNG